MKRVAITLKGISPLLMHRYPMVPVEGMDKLSAAEQAEHAAYRNGDGGLFVPGINLQRAFVSGAVYSKGKGRASLQKVVAACLMVNEMEISLGAKKYEVDTRPVVIPSTKGRILRHRPRLDSWALKFTMDYDELLMTEEQARKVVDDTGSRVGVLDFRPERKGPFGRFMVTEWSVN